MACPIHNHSNFSRLDGLSTPKDIAERSLELEFEACGLTDHDLCAGHVSFFKEMQEYGLKPLLGLESYQAPVTRFDHEKSQSMTDEDGEKYRIDNFHLILLAKNNVGLRNLWRLNTESHKTGFYYNGRVDWDLLKQHSEGLICSSACMAGLLPQAILHGKHDPDLIVSKFREIFGDDFFIELSTYQSAEQVDLNVELAKLANERGIPLIYANDAHYSRPDDYDLHESILSLQYNQKKSELTQPHHAPYLYIMGEQEVREYLYYLGDSVVDEAISNTDLIAKKCNVTLPLRRARTPIFVPDKKWGRTWDMLFDLVKDGFERKIKSDDQEYTDRLERELGVIIKANLVDYFLVVYDYINWAKQQGIMVGPGRGSVSGSLVAYCLGITEIDPLRYGLLFERFYNAGRTNSLPDIDTDFSKAGRDQVKEYVAKKYGKQYVSEVGTVISLQGKGAIDDLGRIMEIPSVDIRDISKRIDTIIEAGIQPDWDEINLKIGNDLVPYRIRYPDLFNYAERLYGHIRAYGVHASGIIVGDEPLADTIPLRWVTKDKKLVTQWPYETLEEFGYMKKDFLALRTLDTLEEVNRILEERELVQIDYDKIQYEEHPEEMWKLLEQGKTTGLFQIEDKPGVKRIAKELKPRSIEELAILLALNRPGPLEAGGLEKLKQVKAGKELARENPILDEITKSTFGILLYQEQIIEFMTRIGYSLEEADEVRALMGKKKVHLVAKEKKRFLEKAQAYLSAHQAITTWQLFEGFSRYAFNLSHAIGYGLILLNTLYAKYYHPLEFTLACIRTVDKASLSRYFNEATRLGIQVLPPEINTSDMDTSIEGDAIRFGFKDIKGFGNGPAYWLMNNRPFTDLDALGEKIRANKITLPNGIQRVAVTSRHLDILHDLGALDAILGEERKMSREDQVDKELELLGVAFSDNSAKILEKHSDEIDACTPIAEMGDNGHFVIGGVVCDLDVSRKTRQGLPYGVVTIRDRDGDEIQFHVWSDALQKYRFMWVLGRAGMFGIQRNIKGTTLRSAKGFITN